MEWIVFSYSLRSQSRSGPRVALWRRLKRLGAISPAGGVQVLPARDACVEAFQWLVQEIRHAGGDALVMRVSQFEGLSDQQLIALFHAARQEDYAALTAEAQELEQRIGTERKPEDIALYQETLAKLRRRHADIARVDYFDSPEGTRLTVHLARIAQSLAAPAPIASIPRISLSGYHDKRWVTRPQPYVDRLACAWLIRRFINPAAPIRYANDTTADEVAFDMNTGEFGHVGNLCTFETMVFAFGLTEPGLPILAEIVHEIDLRDGRFVRPETVGIDLVLAGWHQLNLTDEDMETRGIALVEGVFAACSPTVFQEKKETKSSR